MNRSLKFFNRKRIAKTITTINHKDIKILKPPATHASCTGSTDIKTAANPPNAAYPIRPKLIKPAYPHWIFAPIVITAEIKHMLKIDRATFHD